MKVTKSDEKLLKTLYFKVKKDNPGLTDKEINQNVLLEFNKVKLTKKKRSETRKSRKARTRNRTGTYTEDFKKDRRELSGGKFSPK
ncbi:hypothetical protein [Kangiella shandongensis]|uniref:hypothetical protein n=1 Tax=Kangiella shandongensis TaxID=2763258 RepID=UPI001CC12DAE|nr:hypothetical protein [Kangiella shandongensis]